MTSSQATRLPAAAALRLAQRLLDRDPAPDWTCRPFGEGRFSETFAVTAPCGDATVLRVAPPDTLRQLFYELRMMRREPLIHQRLLKETTVPVPPILAYDFSRTMIDRDILIMPRLEGKPLNAAGLPPRSTRRALREWGAYVAQIHGLSDPDNRFGYLGGDPCMPSANTWADAFAGMFQRELRDITETGVYDPKTADRFMRLLEKHLDVFKNCPRANLLHGDLWVTNLLVAPDGRVTGVIDFDRACWGDTGWDLAIAEYCGITQAPFWEGYGKVPDVSRDEAAIRRFFYLMYEHQKYIVISVSARRNNPAAARRYAAECVTAMDAFQRTGRPVF